MRDYAQESIAENRMKQSRQEKIDRMMCKPGYTWNETLKKCLPAVGSGGNGGGGGENPPKLPDNPESAPELPAMGGTPGQSAGKEIAQEAALRKSQGVSAKK